MTPIDPVDVPDGITLERNRDRPQAVELAARWVCVTALAALVLAALLNVFGQRHVDTVAKGNGARLELSAPGALRSGLYFQGRFRVSAERAIRAPTLVLGGGGSTPSPSTPCSPTRSRRRARASASRSGSRPSLRDGP